MQRYSSAFDATGGMQVKDDENGLYVLYADALERERVLREALEKIDERINGATYRMGSDIRKIVRAALAQ